MAAPEHETQTDGPVFQSLRDLIPVNTARRRSLYEVDKSDRGSLETATASNYPIHPYDLSTARMVALTIVLGGAQLVWSVEQGYATLYLVSLSLSREGTAIVWLCGPISGLLMQPLMGAWSDASRSRFRRRKYIVGATIVVAFSLFTVAYARAVAGVIVDSLSLGIEGRWDPRRDEAVRKMTLGTAVPALIVLDFSLNALQAASRALILDVARGQHTTANAWQGRMTHIANIIGFSLGMVDLAHSPIFAGLPGGQFARLCDLAILILIICSTITIVFAKEEEPLPWASEPDLTAFAHFKQGFVDVKNAISTMPNPIRRLCWAQMLAWSGWFAFLFYATFFVGQLWHKDHPELEERTDLAERAGSLAMLCFSLVALAAGTLLPLLESLGSSAWARKRGALLRRCIMFFTPRNIWTASQLLFGGLMLSTLSISHAGSATIVIALVGISWAVSCWVPFALVMQFIHEIEPVEEDDDDAKVPERFSSATPPVSPLPARTLARASLSSLPTSSAAAQDRVVAALTDCAPLVPRRERRPRGATLLGVHNCFITLPQIVRAYSDHCLHTENRIEQLTSIVASVVFRSTPAGKHTTKDLTRIFAYGGVLSLFSALAVRGIRPTARETFWQDQLLDGDVYEESVMSDNDSA